MSEFSYTSDDGEVTLYYEEHGQGHPLLMIAPGGMRSTVGVWASSTPYDPIKHFSQSYRVIAMDQRNAGRSVGPITGSHGWHTYTADQLALMTHLGAEQFHVAGMCIGGPYIMGLIQQAPERVSSAVMYQSIGLDNNQKLFYAMFDNWADDLEASRPEVGTDDWADFRTSMYGSDNFLFNVDEAFVSACQTPLLVLMGNDPYHPQVTSRRIAELAPRAQFVENWKQGGDVDVARAAVDTFLAEHTPS